MPIDASLLLPGWTVRTDEDGIFAEFHENGTLKRVGVYRQGQPVGEVLHIAEDGLSAFAECVTHFPDERTKSAHNPDPSSDETTLQWVEDRLMGIYDRANFVTRCSFCRKRRAEVGKLIAGPAVYICNECVRLCEDILRNEA